MKIDKIENSEIYVLAIDKVRVYFRKYKKEHDVIYLLDKDENIVASIILAKEFFDTLNESNLYIEELEDFQENEIDENLNYPNEDISKKLKSKKEEYINYKKIITNKENLKSAEFYKGFDDYYNKDKK